MHLHYVLYNYVAAFPEGEQRKALSRHVPGLHALFKRVLAIGPSDPVDSLRNLGMIRSIEDATAFPGAQSALFDAVAHNDAARVAQLAAAGAYLDAWDAEGRTPLLLAARAGHTESAIALVDGGAAIDAARHTEPRTALKAALSESRWKTAAALIARGASPKLGETKQDEYYRKLLGDALAVVSREGDTTSLRRLLEAGIDPDLESTFGKGHTALLSAAKANQVEAARLLIGAGANVNARASYGSPLQIAKGGRFIELVKLLEDAGARE
jgi:ankyrin repeat protein